MHILFLADASSVHSYRWIKYFSAIKGVKVTWFSLTKATMPALENVDFNLIDKKNPITLYRGLRAISKKTPDIIHVHYLGWNGFLSLFFPKTFVVLTAWGSDIVFNSQILLKKLILKKVIQQSNLITCDAWHLKDELVKLGAPKEKVELVMFGIDDHSFIANRKPFKIGESSKKFTVGSIRNLHPVYDLITLLKAAKIVLSRRDDVMFNVAGSGPDLLQLETFVAENNLHKGVKFLGRLESSELCGFYNSLDIYVSTSLSDGGIASSTAEAMLCERPVVITDAAENSDWVTDKESGRLFDCHDYVTLADIILDLLDNQELGIGLGLKAKETIIDRNTYSNEMKKMLKIYQRITGLVD